MPELGHQTLVPFQAFEAADGWLVVACPKETLWRGLCDALGETGARRRRALRRPRRPRREP